MDYFYDCIDCGTEYCPCELAETGDCLVCGRLSGAGCGCDWKGVCVYNEYMQGGGRAKARRKDFEARIVERKDYGYETFVLVLDVGRAFAQRCRRPGSYVFLKAPAADSFYNVPISLLRADERRGEIHVAVKVSGAKSRKLAECRDTITVRGVYRNGIIGIKNLIGIRGRVESSEKLMIITKGIGFAPAVNLLDWIGSRAPADIYIDCDKVDERLIMEYIPEGADVSGKNKTVSPEIHVRFINLREEFSYRARSRESLTEAYKTGGYDKVVVLTSDYYINEIGKEIKVDARANNFHICCGEGLCGACGFTDKSGRSFKMCKCTELYEEIATML